MSATVIPSAVYPPGVTPFGPLTIGSGFTTLELKLLREGWPDSGGVEIISIEAVRSYDNGATWDGVLGVNPTIQFGDAGGVLPNDKFGQPQLSNIARWPIVTPCQLKGRVTLQQSLRTTITITLT